MPRKCRAVVDIGSNSVRLLVVQWDGEQAHCIFWDKITTRLIAGMENGLLQPDAIARTAKALEQLTRHARALGADVLAFGTSAMRDARNSGLLIEECRPFLPHIRILSGDEEADLAYAGAAPAGRRGVIDIGGGSTELMVGEDGVRLSARSFQLGAVRLCEAMPGCSDPADLRQAALSQLQRGREGIAPYLPLSWVGVGGTVTALAALDLGLSRYDPLRIQDHPLTARFVHRSLETLCAMSPAERAALPAIGPQRSDIIPCGAAILSAFFELFEVDGLLVSDRDNLMGCLKKYAFPPDFCAVQNPGRPP